jgi:hypothetical protein
MNDSDYLQHIGEQDRYIEQLLAEIELLKMNEWNRPNDKLTQKIEKLSDTIFQISNWCEAYPLENFPEPDFKKANELLKVGGVSLGAVSASNMRHVLSGIKRIIAEEE